jgi:hypothetical protein
MNDKQHVEEQYERNVLITHAVSVGDVLDIPTSNPPKKGRIFKLVNAFELEEAGMCEVIEVSLFSYKVKVITVVNNGEIN